MNTSWRNVNRAKFSEIRILDLFTVLISNARRSVVADYEQVIGFSLGVERYSLRIQPQNFRRWQSLRCLTLGPTIKLRLDGAIRRARDDQVAVLPRRNAAYAQSPEIQSDHFAKPGPLAGDQFSRIQKWQQKRLSFRDRVAKTNQQMPF